MGDDVDTAMSASLLDANAALARKESSERDRGSVTGGEDALESGRGIFASPDNIATTRNKVGRFSGDDCTHIQAVSNLASSLFTWSLRSKISISLSSLVHL